MNKLLIFLLLFSLSLSAQNRDAYITQFINQWTSEDRSNAYAHASEGHDGNDYFDQSIYYWGWGQKALYYMWLSDTDATRSKTWLDEQIEMTYLMTDKATDFGNGYSHWKTHAKDENGDKATNDVGTPLWVTYSFKTVTSMLRVMKDSPNLLATAHGQSGFKGTTYQDEYDYILAWVEKNVWDYYYIVVGNGNGSNNVIFRSKTHMVSHWMQIAIDLYKCTGTPLYKTVYDQINEDGFPHGSYADSNFQDQFFTSGVNKMWYETFPASTVQDMDHAADVMEVFLFSYMMGEGGYVESDFVGFAHTFNNNLWQSNQTNPILGADRMDGTNNTWRTPEANGAKSYGWYLISSFLPALQTRIRTNIDSNTSWNSIEATNIGAIVFGETYPNFVYPESSGTTPTPIEPIKTVNNIMVIN